MSKHVVFLQGKKVYLRPLDKQTDMKKCQRWINDPETRLYLSRVYPATMLDEEKWFDSLSESDNYFHFAIITVKENKMIGVMGLNKVNWVDRVTTTGTVIGNKKFQNQGLGTEAKMLLLNYCFNTLNLRKVCSEVMGFNKRSIAYSKKCGYKVECVRPKHYYREGKYWDQIFMAVYKKDFQKIWRKFK